MTDSAARSQGANQIGAKGKEIDPAFDPAFDLNHQKFLADLASRIDLSSRIDPASDLVFQAHLERGQIASEVAEAQQDATPGRSEAWGGWPALNKATTAAALGMMSAGYASFKPLRPVGTGLLALVSAQKLLEHYKEREAAAEHALNFVGTALWSVGIGVGSRALQTAGPAINAVTALTSSGIHYYQGKEDWFREAVDAAENGLFAAAGLTGNPAFRAGAVAALAAGWAIDAATKDKGLSGHVAGAVTWSAGAGAESNLWQSVGTGIIATAETTRLLYSSYKNYAQPSAEATTQQPVEGEILPVQSPAPMGVTSPITHAENPIKANFGGIGHGPDKLASAHASIESQFASAASQFLPATPDRTEKRHSNADGSLQPSIGKVWTPAPKISRNRTL